jgi:hypothetical protein
VALVLRYPCYAMSSALRDIFRHLLPLHARQDLSVLAVIVQKCVINAINRVHNRTSLGWLDRALSVIGKYGLRQARFGSLGRGHRFVPVLGPISQLSVDGCCGYVRWNVEFVVCGEVLVQIERQESDAKRNVEAVADPLENVDCCCLVSRLPKPFIRRLRSF